MTEREREYHDLLIQVDTRLANMEKSVSDIEKFVVNRECKANMERIRSLEWFVRGAMLAAISAMIKAFWPQG